MNRIILAQGATGIVGTLGPTGQYVRDGDKAVSGILGTALALIVILGVAMIIFAGYRYIMARGDQREIQAAQSIITNTIIGLIIAFLAYLIVTLVLKSLGIGSALPSGLPI